MAEAVNIVIADESALHLLLHSDLASRVESTSMLESPLGQLATSQGMMSFNFDNRLYGEHPVKLLVNDAAQWMKTLSMLEYQIAKMTSKEC